MTDIRSEVISYQYEFRDIQGENAAFVHLFDVNNKLLCMAAFVERKGALPAPRQNLNGTVFLSFRRSDLGSVIDMLRNEKPVMFNWSEENCSAQITTGKEPVGEEENRHIASFLRPKKKTPGKKTGKDKREKTP